MVLEKKQFKLIATLTCKVRNVWYIITCNGSVEQYVQNIQDTLAARVRVYKQHINLTQYTKVCVSKHIDECCQTDP